MVPSSCSVVELQPDQIRFTYYLLVTFPLPSLWVILSNSTYLFIPTDGTAFRIHASRELLLATSQWSLVTNFTK